MVDLDVIVHKLQYFTGHPPADLLQVPSVLEIHVIGEHLDFVWASRQEWVPVS